MTHRIYYTDPYCRTFDAVVTNALEHDGRPAVTLDRSAFYPTSGGQAFDTGRLGDARVVETLEVDDDVVHVLSAAIDRGAAVAGEVDWPRRFDHMQQHTGQHILSAAFDRLFDNPTASVHLGADLCTIDLAREASPDEITQAVDEANRVVWEDRTVSIRFVSPEEAQTLRLRREPARTGTLRLIEVAGFDLSACGGTHVTATGSIGLIAVVGHERFRGATRISFVCGGRALRMFRVYRDAVTATTRVLSVTAAELPAAVERVQAESKELRKTVGALERRLAPHDAARLLTAASTVGRVRVVVHVLPDADASGLKTLATAAVAEGSAAVVLLSSSSVVVARSADVAMDANALLRQLTARFGGRGGGKADFAQGGGLAGAAEEIASAARDLIATVLNK